MFGQSWTRLGNVPAVWRIRGRPNEPFVCGDLSAAVQALVLYGSYARHPLLMSEEYLNERIELIDRLWGTGDFVLGMYIPTVSVDDARRRAWARFVQPEPA
jgi:hypothetical protein